ncbi:MAG: putative aliphatic sulfonates transport permease protein SsuC [Paracidovorax wautersii]|uniref:Putative aliphatic sulfonates transport permease protein SsuC n=1 Tax=Paracidovorax wautersii TaxID=1177982 RepID=A0A7V8FQR8_9BURK|nr:MAG: putative aliphatic sulfonates transport permease protein SsuC [Paracidovorax wautersii]
MVGSTFLHSGRLRPRQRHREPIDVAIPYRNSSDARLTDPRPVGTRRQTPRLDARGLLILSWLAPFAVVIAWEWLARTGWLSPQALPAPTRVAATAWQLIEDGRLLTDLGVSLLRAAAGFAIGGGIGFALGTAVGFSRLAEALLDRSIQMVRAVPFLALLPLVIVWFGVDEGGKIFLVALGVMFPIYINTVLGIRQVDPKLVELGRVTGLGGWGLVRRIILPGAMPSILAGVRYALAVAWLALVVAETIATTRGIGFLAMDAREFLQTDVIVLTIVVYAAIGVLSDAVARALERRWLAWHPNYAAGAKR